MSVVKHVPEGTAIQKLWKTTNLNFMEHRSWPSGGEMARIRGNPRRWESEQQVLEPVVLEPAVLVLGNRQWDRADRCLHQRSSVLLHNRHLLCLHELFLLDSLVVSRGCAGLIAAVRLVDDHRMLLLELVKLLHAQQLAERGSSQVRCSKRRCCDCRR